MADKAPLPQPQQQQQQQQQTMTTTMTTTTTTSSCAMALWGCHSSWPRRISLVIIGLLILSWVMGGTKQLFDFLVPAIGKKVLRASKDKDTVTVVKTAKNETSTSSSILTQLTTSNESTSSKEGGIRAQPDVVPATATATAIATTDIISSTAPQGEQAASSKPVVKAEASPSRNNSSQYYYLHIPKVGGNSMHGLLTHNGALVYNFGGGASNPTTSFHNWVLENPKRRIFMTEGSGFNQFRPPHSLVMFRNPISHVLSQFFHCTESADHAYARNRMPSNSGSSSALLKWLRYWEGVRQSTTLEQQQSTDKQSHKDIKWSCYNPINLQSWIIGYPSTKEEFDSWFDVIGIQSQFHRSFCLMITHVLDRVPPVCNCTPTSAVPGERREEELPKNDTHFSHGVKHHGDSFQPSDEEAQLIRNLTQYDHELYQHAQEIFEQQVAAVEQEYGVTFCTNS